MRKIEVSHEGYREDNGEGGVDLLEHEVCFGAWHMRRGQGRGGGVEKLWWEEGRRRVWGEWMREREVV